MGVEKLQSICYLLMCRGGGGDSLYTILYTLKSEHAAV
jgi:hypothetical protein